MKKLRLPNSEGFTFIEVLVFASILSFLMIALTTTVVTSLQKMTTVEHRLYATRYAEELQEWLRAEQEADFTTFTTRDPTTQGTVYCFNMPLDFRDTTQIANIWAAAAAGMTGCDYTGIGSAPQSMPPLIYKRYAILTSVGPAPQSQVNVQIIVEWKDGNKYFSTPLNTVFTNAKEN